MPNLLTTSTLPDVVYHYCSVDTFYQIITNHTLRLSDIERATISWRKNGRSVSAWSTSKRT